MQRWSAPKQISGLLAKTPDDLKQYQPQFKYSLLDLKELIADNKLPEANLAAIQFKMDAGCSYEEFRMHGRQEGLEQGLERGLEQGLEQGKAEMLLNLLKYKFNYVPDSIKLNGY